MRRALTLIELLLTMVIVGLVMMVIPKIIFVTNKSFEAIVKEEALYNALALAGVVVSLPWDEANRNMSRFFLLSRLFCRLFLPGRRSSSGTSGQNQN